MGWEEFAKEVQSLTTVQEVLTANDLLKKRLSEIERSLATAFEVGDTVLFETKGVRRTGVVEKVNAKSVIVSVFGKTWAIAPSLLEKVVS
jgi:uncharacterized protein YkvS